MRIIELSLFSGGKNCRNIVAFERALEDKRAEYSKKGINVIIKKKLTPLIVRDKRMNARDITEDLTTACDGYVVLSHIHQGLNKHFQTWDMSTFNVDIRGFSKHIGNFSGDKYKDVIFQQNKYAYLEAVPDIVNPSLRLELNDEGHLSNRLKSKISDFMKANFEYNDKDGKVNGWIIKCPYMTNCSNGVKNGRVFVYNALDVEIAFSKFCDVST
jgi:hypothetical protein